MPEKLKREREPFPGKMEKIETYGGTSEVVDISPENPKTDVPVLLAPAWACSINVYKPAIETLASKGRRVISLNHARNRRDSSFDEKLLDQYSAAELTKAFNFLDVLDQKKIEKVDVIAHSEGCLNAVIAATLRPDKFRNLVLFAPAGLIGDDNAWRLLKGFAAQRIKDIRWQPLSG
ncbi:MAG: alpha/beta fold hydrolase [Patescibacteria group bacterium]